MLKILPGKYLYKHMCTSVHILYSKQQMNTIILKEFFFININKCAYYVTIKAL